MYCWIKFLLKLIKFLFIQLNTVRCYRKGGAGDCYYSIQSMLVYEKEQPSLTYPSGSRTVLRLHRALGRLLLFKLNYLIIKKLLFFWLLNFFIIFLLLLKLFIFWCSYININFTPDRGLLYHRMCKRDFLCSWPSLNSYLK